MIHHLTRSAFALAAVLALAGALAAAGLTSIASAQDATPAAIPWVTTPPGPPDPALCHAASVPKERYLALRGTPTAATPVPLADLFVTPADQIGSPADPATVEAVTATIMEYGACVNAGKWLNNANLYTEAGFAEDYAHADDGFLDFIASGKRPASLDETYYIFAVSAVRVLPDGRVGAVIQFGRDAKYGADYLIFAKAGDRYLIDFWVDEFEAVNVPTSGTPAA
jgi:hypothetical protein